MTDDHTRRRRSAHARALEVHPQVGGPGRRSSAAWPAASGSMLVSVVVVLALWEGFIRLYHIQPMIAKIPLDVWRYMFTQHADKVHGLPRAPPGTDRSCSTICKTTIRDAGIGYVAGIVLGLVRRRASS